MAAFKGFKPTTLEFYAELAHNNERDWFISQRARYLSEVIEPAQAFVEALGKRLQKRRPQLGFDINYIGRGSIKKIHTDQRFQKGRPPLKTYAQIMFWEGPLETKKANSCLMVHIDPERIKLAAGLKYFDGRLLKDFRQAVVDPDHGGRLAEAIAGLKQYKGYSLKGVHFKKTPRGFDAAHPRAPLLLHDALYVELSRRVPQSFFSSRFVGFCAKHFRQMENLHAWCVDFLAESAGVRTG